VPSDLQAWILSQPHPQLANICRGLDLPSDPVPAHLTGRAVPETIAETTCSLATATSPIEIDVYGAVGDQYGLVYRVPAPAGTGGVHLINYGTSVSGNTLTVTLVGYTDQDSLCCPSSRWTQNYTFDGTNASQGPLVETSGPNLITFTSVGPVQLGMTTAQVHTAEPSLTSGPDGTGCTGFGPRGGSQPHVVLASSSDRVIGIDAPSGYRTDTSIGVGSTRDEIRAAYAGRHIEEISTYPGQVVLVQGPSSWLGFVLGHGTTVQSITVGEHDYAAQFEVCIGPN
jgi:hypothetical protein